MNKKLFSSIFLSVSLIIPSTSIQAIRQEDKDGFVQGIKVAVGCVIVGAFIVMVLNHKRRYDAITAQQDQMMDNLSKGRKSLEEQMRRSNVNSQLIFGSTQPSPSDRLKFRLSHAALNPDFIQGVKSNRDIGG